MINYPYAKFSKAEIVKDIKRIHNIIFMEKGFRSMQVNLTFERLKKRLLEEEIMGSQSNFESPHSYS